MTLGKVRIIGGQWRGRKLSVPDKVGLRPTPDRVRETLFNWLMGYLPDSHCLDLFAGSGALGIEAASRGAKQVILVEKDPEIFRNLQRQIVTLSADNVTVIRADAQQFLQNTSTPFDIVFLDPPFGKNLLVPCCEWLERNGWLNKQAHIYLEVERTLGKPNLPTSWQIVRQQTAGQVAYFLGRVIN